MQDGQGEVQIMERLLSVPYLLRAAFLLAVALEVFTPDLGQAQSSVRVIGNDYGGYLAQRVIEVGTSVEIKGDVCYSSCTMFLGARNICVSPTTKFGFHGPSRQDGSLEPDYDSQWSEIIASHYNAQFRGWYMSAARHEKEAILVLTGADLIRLGYRECPS